MVDSENNQVNGRQNVQLTSNENDAGSVSSSHANKMNCDSVPTASTERPAPLDGDTPKGNLKQENKNAEDEDDPVVHEIPVFLAQSLAKQLFLYQYPVRPCSMSYDSAQVISSKVKSKQQQVEITMALNTSSSNYDESKGEQIALNVDGCEAHNAGDKARSKTKTDSANDSILNFPDGRMDRQVLTSTRAVRDTSRYAVGILDQNELHITPLEGVLSLRPSMEYLDQSDKTAKAEGRGLLTDNDLDDIKDSSGMFSDGEDGGDPDMKAVTVRFARGGQNEKEKYAKFREKSYEYQQKKLKEEPWVHTKFHQMKSAKWEEQSQKLFCRKMDDEIMNSSCTSNTYLNHLK